MTCASSRRASTTPTSPSPAAGRPAACTGAVMNEMRAPHRHRGEAAVPRTDHLAGRHRPAVGRPAHLRRRCSRRSSPIRRSGGLRCDRRVRAVARRHHDGHARASRPCRSASRPTARRACSGGCRRRRSTRAGCSSPRLVIYARRLRRSRWSCWSSSPYLAFAVPLPGHPLAYVVAFIARDGRRCSRSGCSSRPSPRRPGGHLDRHPAVLRRHVPRRRVPAARVPARGPGQRIGELHALPASRASRTPGSAVAPQLVAARRSWRSSPSSSARIAVRVFRWE